MNPTFEINVTKGTVRRFTLAIKNHSACEELWKEREIQSYARFSRNQLILWIASEASLMLKIKCQTVDGACEMCLNIAKISTKSYYLFLSWICCRMNVMNLELFGNKTLAFLG